MPTTPLWRAEYAPAFNFAAAFIGGHCTQPFTDDTVASQLLLAYVQEHGDNDDMMYVLAYELVDRACALRNNGVRSCFHPDPEVMAAAADTMTDVDARRGAELAAAFEVMLTHDVPLARVPYTEALADETKKGAFYGVLLFDLQHAHQVAHLLHGGCTRGRLRPIMN